MPTYTKIHSVLIEIPGESGFEEYRYPGEGRHVESVRVTPDYIEGVEVDGSGTRKPKGFRNYRRFALD